MRTKSLVFACTLMMLVPWVTACTASVEDVDRPTLNETDIISIGESLQSDEPLTFEGVFISTGETDQPSHIAYNYVKADGNCRTEIIPLRPDGEGWQTISRMGGTESHTCSGVNCRECSFNGSGCDCISPGDAFGDKASYCNHTVTITTSFNHPALTSGFRVATYKPGRLDMEPVRVGGSD